MYRDKRKWRDKNIFYTYKGKLIVISNERTLLRVTAPVLVPVRTLQIYANKKKMQKNAEGIDVREIRLRDA